MRRIEQLCVFVNECGYFFNAFMEKGICVNSGHNCKHPDQKEKAEGVGCCYSWSCPLGVEPDEGDFKNTKFNNQGYKHIKGAFIIPFEEGEPA